MSKVEQDPLTGQYTTGHIWDGIRELRTPIPKWWLFSWLFCIAFAVVYVWVLPAIPLGSSASTGTYGYTARTDFKQKVAEANAERSLFITQMASLPLAEIAVNEPLFNYAFKGGRAAFNVNCIGCHGTGGGGQLGQFPALNDDDWIWGGTLEEIYTTINHGVRNGGDEARDSQMPAFGDQLEPQEIEHLADYVLALAQNHDRPSKLEPLPGHVLYEDNCLGCHGEAGAGGRALGAPRLNDAIWLYGGERDEIIRQIAQPKLGVMPAFGPRLANDGLIKMLTIYVHALGGGEADQPE